MTPDEIRNDYWKTILHLFTYEEPIIVGGTVGKSKTKPLVRQGIFVPDTPDRKAQCPICNRVGGGITPAVLPHHRTYGSVSGGSCEN